MQIDVEGAELEIMRGASKETLQKIRQIVMEVHDIDRRVNQVQRLLEVAGFELTGTEKGMCHTMLLFAARLRPSESRKCMHACRALQ